MHFYALEDFSPRAWRKPPRIRRANNTVLDGIRGELIRNAHDHVCHTKDDLIDAHKLNGGRGGARLLPILIDELFTRRELVWALPKDSRPYIVAFRKFITPVAQYIYALAQVAQYASDDSRPAALARMGCLEGNHHQHVVHALTAARIVTRDASGHVIPVPLSPTPPPLPLPLGASTTPIPRRVLPRAQQLYREAAAALRGTPVTYRERKINRARTNIAKKLTQAYAAYAKVPAESLKHTVEIPLYLNPVRTAHTLTRLTLPFALHYMVRADQYRYSDLARVYCLQSATYAPRPGTQMHQAIQCGYVHHVPSTAPENERARKRREANDKPRVVPKVYAVTQKGRSAALREWLSASHLQHLLKNTVLPAPFIDWLVSDHATLEKCVDL